MGQRDTWQSRFLVPRSLVTPARRIFDLLVTRLPEPAQKLAMSAIHRAARRWPELARLLGIATSRTPRNESAPSIVADGAAKEANLACLRSGRDFADRAQA